MIRRKNRKFIILISVFVFSLFIGLCVTNIGNNIYASQNVSVSNINDETPPSGYKYVDKWGTADVYEKTGRWNNIPVSDIWIGPGEINNNGASSFVTNDGKIEKSKVHIVTFSLNTQFPEDSSNLFKYDNHNWGYLEYIYGSPDLSEVKNMSSMFQGLSNLKSLDVSDWNTSNVENMSSLFKDVSNITSWGASGFLHWKTENVKNMSHMFENVGTVNKAGAVDVSEWNTQNVTDMSYMFTNSKIASFGESNFENWNTSNVTNMAYMFSKIGLTQSLKIKNWDTSKVTDMSHLFEGAYPQNQTGFDVEKWKTEKVTNMSYMFVGADAPLNVKSFDTSQVTDMSHMFENVSGDQNFEVDDWKTDKVTDMSSMFSGSWCAKLNLNSWNTSHVINMNKMFANTFKLTQLDVDKWDTSSVNDMSYMFNSASALNKLDLNKWRINDLLNMRSMFDGAAALTVLDLENWKTSNVTDMQSTFKNTKSLKKIGIDNWDTQNVQDMSSLFYGSAVESLDLNNWDTRKVTTMNSMFRNTSQLGKLELSKWDVGMVRDFSQIFCEMPVLEKLNLTSWDTSSSYGFSGAFAGDVKLATLVLGKATKKLEQAQLPEISTSDGMHTGKWIRIDPQTPKISYNTSQLFMKNYDGAYPGTYVWERTPGEPITIKYMDQSGTLLDFKVVKGGLGEKYQTEAKEFKDYTLESSPDETLVTFTDEPQTVIYTYTKNHSDDQSDTKGSVSVNYQDEEGNYLDYRTLSGEIGKRYVTYPLIFSGYTLVQKPNNAEGIFTEQSQTVTYIYKKDATPTPDNGYTYPKNNGNVKVGSVVYGTKHFYLYKNFTFKHNERRASYVKKPRINRPMFVVNKIVKNENGRIRYYVKDVNHKSATAGKVGYITANGNYVSPVYYQTKQAKVTVINPNGVNAYKKANLTKKAKNYKQGSVLNVKKIVKHNLTTRYKLSNGQYITANRKLVKTGKQKMAKQVKVNQTIKLYRDVNLTKRTKSKQVFKKGIKINIKKFEYSQANVMNKPGTKRYVIKGGYITANSEFVKIIK